MNKSDLARQWFIKTALSYLGTNYIWGGDDPSGFDCSGLVVECLKSVGLIEEKQDFSANSLLHKFKNCKVDDPSEGCLIFVMQKQRAVHVAICLDQFFQISASGGTESTISTIQASKVNAFIKIRPINRLGHSIIIADPFLL